MTNRFFVKSGSEVKIKILGTDVNLEAAIIGQGFTLSEDTHEIYDGFDPSERIQEGQRELHADGTYTVNDDRYNHCDRVVNGHRYDNNSWSKLPAEELATREAKRVEAARVEAARVAALQK